MDTGAPEGANVVGRASVLEGDSDPSDPNGHGTAMLETILGENADARVMSVRALGADGRGTSAAVYAAIELAAGSGAGILNLSFAGYAVEDNAAIAEAVSRARGEGCEVVAAAGNAGMDARWFTPASLEGVFTCGAAAGDGSRLPSSNYGEAVNAYIYASSTSYAAARATGWLSANLAPGWREAILESDLRPSLPDDVGEGPGSGSEATELRGGSGGVQAQSTDNLIADERYQNMGNWGINGARWSSKYTAGGTNLLSLTTAYSPWEWIYTSVPVVPNTDYVFSYKYKTVTDVSSFAMKGTSLGIKVRPSHSESTGDSDVLGANVSWTTTAMGDYSTVAISFNSGSRASVELNMLGVLNDGRTYTDFVYVKDLTLKYGEGVTYGVNMLDSAEYQNMNSWTDLNGTGSARAWSSSYSSDNINTLTVVTGKRNWEYAYVPVSLKANVTYRFSYYHKCYTAFSKTVNMPIGICIYKGAATPNGSIANSSNFVTVDWGTAVHDWTLADATFTPTEDMTACIYILGNLTDGYTYANYFGVKGLSLVPVQYQVNYYSSDGASYESDVIAVGDSTKARSKGLDTPQGYSLFGWAKSSPAATADYKPDASFVPDSDLDLYPIYSRAITYSANYTGGTVATTSDNTPQLYYGGQARAIALPGPSGRCLARRAGRASPQAAGPPGGAGAVQGGCSGASGRGPAWR